jgi:hypothetical protein
VGTGTTKLERLTEDLLIQHRDKRVEELEKRLKSMEDLLKCPVSNHQSGLNGAEFGNDSRRPEAPPFSNQSEAGTSDSSSNLDPASTIADENSQASDFGLPSPEGKCKSAMHFPDLIVFSVLHCSHHQPKRDLASSSQLR